MSLKNISTLLLLGIFATTAPSADAAQPAVVAPSGKLSPEQELATFKLPPGFVAQLVAAEPDIAKPMNLAFDAHGRLWVTDTVDYPFPVLDGPGHDTVKILSNFDENGRAKTIQTFATGLTVPLGVMPLDDGKQQSAIVYSVPSVRRYIDTDGDGKADKSEPMLAGYGHVDTHGMTNNFTRGFDGWIYANHGFKNDSTVAGADGSNIAMNSGSTYRFRPDGSHVEYFAHGQVNPFGLCFDPLGNLFSADCHSRPQYMLLRGGYYPSFGKPDDGLGFGPEMCRHDHGSTAIAGTMVYAATQFPKEFQGNLFDGNPVTNAVNRDRIDWTGATPKAVEQPDFLVSKDPWFRPVQVTLGPDGAMYVADFYNKIIGHYEVDLHHPGRDRTSGRIWRIVYQGDSAKPPVLKIPDFSKASVSEQIAALGDSNLTVRLHATNRLADTGGAAAGLALQQAQFTSPAQKAHAIWAMERLSALKPEQLAAAAADSAPMVRVHAMRILSERATWQAADQKLAVAGLADVDPFVQMAAADAMARHPDGSFVRPLLALRTKVPAGDTHLLHTVRMALREQLAVPGVLAGAIAEAKTADDRVALLDSAVGVKSADAGAFAGRMTAELEMPQDMAVRSIRHAVRWAVDDAAISNVATAASRRFANDTVLQLDLLKSVKQSLSARGGATPEAVRAWAAKVVSAVLAEPPGAKAEPRKRTEAAIEMAGSMKLVDAAPAVRSLVLSASADVAIRSSAARALVAIDPAAGAEALLPILRDADAPAGLRVAAATEIGTVKDSNVYPALLTALITAPENVQRAIAMAMAGSHDGGEALLGAITAGKASPRLLTDKTLRDRLQAAGIEALESRLATLTKGLPDADTAVQTLIERRRQLIATAPPARYSADRGKALFLKNCAVCHRIANEGAQVGPQLDGVGKRGVDRLLEDVLDPSRNVDGAFRYSVLTLEDGDVVTGLQRRVDGVSIVFVDAQGKEFTIAASKIKKRTESQLSLMPANFGEVLPAADLGDLMAFLLAR